MSKRFRFAPAEYFQPYYSVGQAGCLKHPPGDMATRTWYTGIDPIAKKPVRVARHLPDRKLQRALMQFFKPENWFTDGKP